MALVLLGKLIASDLAEHPILALKDDKDKSTAFPGLYFVLCALFCTGKCMCLVIVLSTT